MAAALVVAVVGTFVPGCWGSDEGEPFGKICAAPHERGKFCVPAVEGPAKAWQEAINDGDPPITMWVSLPNDITYDELVLASGVGMGLRAARLRQKELVSEKPVDAVGTFENAITEKASAEKEPLRGCPRITTS